MKLVHDYIASRSPSKHDQRPPEITGHMVLSSLRIALLPLIPEAPDREVGYLSSIMLRPSNQLLIFVPIAHHTAPNIFPF